MKGKKKMILFKNDAWANFEELKAEIYLKISNAQNDAELIKELKELINFYETSTMTE